MHIADFMYVASFQNQNQSISQSISNFRVA